MADVHKPAERSAGARDAEDLLRRAARSGDDPFLALYQSCRPKFRGDVLSPAQMEDEDR